MWRGVVGVVLALGLSGPALAQKVIPFASLDRATVEVGETVTWTVEALGRPSTDDERDAWVAALGAVHSAGPGWAVEKVGPVHVRETGPIVELRRAISLRALEAGDLAVSTVAVGGGSTPALSARAYPASPRALESAGHVVAVVAEGEVEGRPFRRAGSAFLVGDDALVTAYHVVAGARRVVVELPNGRRLATRAAWALDPERDVAVLRVDGRRARAGGLRPLPLAPGRDDPAGVAFSGGWPNDPDTRAQAVTVGRRHPDLHVGGRRVRVSSNPVRPGDSGGPLLDAQGRVLGVIVSGRSTDGDPDLLRQDVCLAADVLPAVEALRRTREPTALRAALREAAAREPSAQALEAVDAVRLGRRREGHLARVAQAARLDPDDPVLQFLAGSILEEAGDEARAAGAYEGASRAGYFPAAYALAHHHLRRGDADRADSLFSVIRAGGPYAQLGAMGAARALVDQGRLHEARSALDEVLAHDPHFAPALYLLGLAHLAEGDEDGAWALVVRLASQPGWAASLRLLIEAPALRPAALQPLPIAEWRRR